MNLKVYKKKGHIMQVFSLGDQATETRNSGRQHLDEIQNPGFSRI